MKNYIFSIIALLFIVACSNENSNTLLLKGEIKGLKKGALLLQKVNDTAYISLDSVRIDGDSRFEFSQPINEPEVLYLTMRFDDSLGTKKRIPFFAEAKEMTMTTTLENYELESEINGSVNQEKWNAHKELIARYKDRNLELIEKQLNALKSGNDSLAQVYGSQQQRLRSTQYLATINFAKNNSDYEIAPFLMLLEVFDANLKYHDTIYKLLSPKIKDSKYGKALESFIQERKTDSL